MDCMSLETLLAYAARDTTEQERLPIEEHLGTGCEPCRRTLDEVAGLRSTLADFPLEVAAPWLARRAAARALEATAQPRGLISHVAELVFDAFRAPVPYGVRAGAASSERRLYRAGDFEIDLRLAPGDVGFVRIVGQLLCADERGEDARVVDAILLTGGLEPLPAIANDFGEFVWDRVPEGTYELALAHTGGTLVVESFSTAATKEELH